MSIYDIDFNIQYTNLLPVTKRNPLFIGWGVALMKPLQWLRDLFFNDYVTGSTAPKYDNTLSYVKGDRVRFTDKGVYEAQATIPAMGLTPVNAIAWNKVQDLWIGLRERAKYTPQKIILEYALNKYFETTFRQPNAVYNPTKSDIYITNLTTNNNVFLVGLSDSESNIVNYKDLDSLNFVRSDYSFSSNNFSISIPLIVYNSLGSDKENIIRSYADKYILAGIAYNIIPY